MEEIEVYFDSLAISATKEKKTLAELVKSNATLTTRNATLTATIAGLQQQFHTIKRGTKGTNPREDPENPKALAPNAKNKCSIQRMTVTS